MHHKFILNRLVAVAKGNIKRLMILVPPGAAKSTYTSVVFPPWFLANSPGSTILACSYAYKLIESFGRRCRNLIRQHEKILGYRLADDSQAAGDWETSSGGRYFCAGVGAGIAGHRADLGFIDDYLGSQEDADSKIVREKQWDWYWNDFLPRLKPQAAQVIIANRRHEDDLVGRLLAEEGDRWTVIRLPMLAEAEDPLGRKPGDILWPEWFTFDMIAPFKKKTRTWAGLYQQRPAPEEGDYFHRDWLVGYEPQELPSVLRLYGAGDFGVSEARGADRTCFGVAGLDGSDVLWVLPDIYWDYVKADPPDRKIDGILGLCERQEPVEVWAEKGHISKSLKPFLRLRMRERHHYVYLNEVTPVRDKETRAQAIRSRMAQGMVRFPKFAPWWNEAEHELLTFPGGTHDDFVDFLGHLGRGIDRMVRPSTTRSVDIVPQNVQAPPITMRWIKDNIRRKEHAVAASDN